MHLRLKPTHSSDRSCIISCSPPSQATATPRLSPKCRRSKRPYYKNIDVYVYGIEAARRLNDSIAQLDLAKRGYAEYGTQNVSFVGQLINEHLQHNDFDGCYKLVNEAIAATPDSMAAVKSQLYDILGVIYEQQDKSEAAIEAFDKAISIDATQGKNYYDKARVIYNQAVKIDESMVDAPESERKAKVDPLLLDAAKLFEKAYEIDSTNLTNIPRSFTDSTIDSEPDMRNRLKHGRTADQSIRSQI